MKVLNLWARLYKFSDSKLFRICKILFFGGGTSVIFLSLIIKQSSSLTMINHLVAICRFSFPNHNFFPVLNLKGRLGASTGVSFFVILKSYFQYFCPVLSILIYFRVFPVDGDECSIFLTFSTFPKNADFFFWAMMEQDTTGIICFMGSFSDYPRDYLGATDQHLPSRCFNYAFKAEA